MNAAQVLDHFDRICDAPDAIPRLRRFILDLAVRGKLVEQDSNDEPASELLKRIRDEKARLVNEGKQRESKPSLRHSETPFAIPDSWMWVRFGDVVRVGTGKLDANAAVETGAYPFFTCSQTPSRIDTYSFDTSAVLLAGNGDFNVKYYKGRFDAYQRTYVIEPLSWNLSFCFFLVTSQRYRIIENQRGSAIPYLKLADITDPVVPLPPLAEQHRIVLKVEELMALCDRLEATQAERESRRIELAAASLHRLNNGADADEFREHARFHLHHLPRLTTRPEHIQQLRQTILNLAIRGKLVPQDSNDEPVSELLERLVSLGSEGGKVPKPLRPLDVDALPSELPFAWVWVQAQDLCRPSSLITYGVLKPIWVDVGVPTVRVQDMQDGTILVEGVGQCSPERAAKFGKTTLEPGDLLIAKDGATLGKTAFVPPLLAGGNITQHVLRFPLTPHVASLFIRLVIDSPHGQAWMRSETKGVALPGVNVGDFRRMPIPLPPLAEQHRIVAKVDELMALVDALETQLATARTTAEKLMEAVVAELTRSGVIYAPLRNDFAGLSADQPNVLYGAEGPGAA